MPGLTLSQRLTDPEGLPTVAAVVAVVTLMLVAAVAAFAVAPRGGQAENAGRSVSASRVAGDLSMAAPAGRPSLGTVAALPRWQAVRRRPGIAAPERAEAPPTPSATPSPTAAPEPTATPAPTTVATPAPPAPPAQIPAAAPSPRPTPAPTFDTSG
jgi:hypothetical protein